MPGSSDSIKYKSLVVTLLGLLITLVGFIGGSTLTKLDRLEQAVIVLQANKVGDNYRMTQIESRMTQIERVLMPQIDYLTRWLEDTFGAPKPKGKVQFGRQ